MLAVSTVIQMGTSLLDLLGVLLIGLVASLAVTTIQGQPPPPFVQEASGQLGLDDLSSQALVLALGAVASVFLLTKSILSSYLMRRVFIFLAHRQAQVSANLARALLAQNLTIVQSRSSQETAYALIQGSSAATLGVLGQSVIAVSEASLLIVLGAALLAISPVVALCCILYFVFVAVLLQLALGKWATRVGRTAAKSDIESLDLIQESVGAFREIFVANRRSKYVERIASLRMTAAGAAADQQFISTLPKYMFEAALVLGGFALALTLFATQGLASAVGTLALFLVAGARVMPSISRLQSATLNLRNAAAVASSTFDLAIEVAQQQPRPDPVRRDAGGSREVSAPLADFAASIRLEGVTFTYPGSQEAAVSDVTMRVGAGRSLALVGASGAGKSTLADVILGIIEPDHGSVHLGSRTPQEAISSAPGAVGYVPQHVYLSNGTIRTNVAVGLPHADIDDELVWKALERAHLADFVRQMAEQLNARVGERGIKLSGGQRQRLGIARALYSEPRLIVLDEATSALDAETEAAVTQMIHQLKQQVTTVVIAHRLSTVRHVDEVAFLEGGRLLGVGSFEEVRQIVPAFDRQARLMGFGPH